MTDFALPPPVRTPAGIRPARPRLARGQQVRRREPPEAPRVARQEAAARHRFPQAVRAGLHRDPSGAGHQSRYRNSLLMRIDWQRSTHAFLRASAPAAVLAILRVEESERGGLLLARRRAGVRGQEGRRDASSPRSRSSRSSRLANAQAPARTNSEFSRASDWSGIAVLGRRSELNTIVGVSKTCNRLTTWVRRCWR